MLQKGLPLCPSSSTTKMLPCHSGCSGGGGCTGCSSCPLPPGCLPSARPPGGSLPSAPPPPAGPLPWPPRGSHTSIRQACRAQLSSGKQGETVIDRSKQLPSSWQQPARSCSSPRYGAQKPGGQASPAAAAAVASTEGTSQGGSCSSFSREREGSWVEAASSAWRTCTAAAGLQAAASCTSRLLAARGCAARGRGSAQGGGRGVRLDRKPLAQNPLHTCIGRGRCSAQGGGREVRLEGKQPPCKINPLARL